MAEDAVKDYLYSQLIGFHAQPLEIPDVAQKRIYAFIACRIVAVIGVGFEDGIEINAGNAERRDIIQLLLYALKIAAEIIVVAVFAVRIGLPALLLKPRFMHDSVGIYVLFLLSGVIESVRKYLIYYSAAQPVGR